MANSRASTGASARNERLPSSGLKSLAGAQAGLLIDMFDVYLPIIALAPATAYFEPYGISESANRIIVAVVFAAALLGRPLGALVFGYLSDRGGRYRFTPLVLIALGGVLIFGGAAAGPETRDVTLAGGEPATEGACLSGSTAGPQHTRKQHGRDRPRPNSA
jgi:MFS family permease